jgi:hypothetical protein
LSFFLQIDALGAGRSNFNLGLVVVSK